MTRHGNVSTSLRRLAWTSSFTPASARTRRSATPAVGSFEKQLAGLRRLAAVAEDAFGQIRGQLGRSDARRVARHEHECAALGRQLAAQLQQRQQVLVDLPRLALRPVAVLGGSRITAS